MTTIDRWVGAFGNDYTDRNLYALSESKRGRFWAALMEKYPCASVVEVGCNVGANLRHISAARAVGVDVNEKALSIARTIPGVEVFNAPAHRLPFPDTSFDMSFTVGVLIHIPDNELGGVIDEMYRTTRRYLLTAEYEATETTEKEYRGECGLLWARPYGEIVGSRYPALRCIDIGMLGRSDGFDDVVWRLWDKQ